MHFAGLPLSTLLPLFAGVAAVTFVLYVLKLRRRAVPVPFARIWDRVLRDKESSELFSQLKRWLSLLLQIALLAALVLALGDPRPVGQGTERHDTHRHHDEQHDPHDPDERPPDTRLGCRCGRFARSVSGGRGHRADGTDGPSASSGTLSQTCERALLAPSVRR